MILQIGSTVHVYKKNTASSSTKFSNVVVTELSGGYITFTGATVASYGSDISVPWDSVDIITLISDPTPVV